MALITVEDCFKHVPNHFALVLLASRRARERMKKEQRYLFDGHKASLAALIEIASGKLKIQGNMREYLLAYLEKIKHRGFTTVSLSDEASSK